MVFADAAIQYFSLRGSRVRSAFAESNSTTPFYYADEPFHTAYRVLAEIWKYRKSIRSAAEEYEIGRETIKKWQQGFVMWGASGLLPPIQTVQVDERLEQLVVLVKSARSHEHSSYAMRLAEALRIPDATLA